MTKSAKQWRVQQLLRLAELYPDDASEGKAKILLEVENLLFSDSELSEDEGGPIQEDPIKEELLIYLNMPCPKDFHMLSSLERHEYTRAFLDNGEVPDSYKTADLEKRNRICSRDIIEELLGVKAQKDLRNQVEARRVGAVMNKLLNWERRTYRISTKTVRGFVRL